MDGTLLDTIGDIADAMNGIMAKYGLPERSEADYAALVGKGAQRLVEDVIPKSLDRQVILEEYREALRSKSGGRTGVYEGIPELLNRLSELSLPLAILTNKPQATAEKVCARYFSSWTLTHIRGQVDSLPPKPHPGQGQQIVADWGILPEECLYLGDTEVDWETARLGGFFFVGCTWGFRSRRELEKAGADLIVDRPEEVMALFA